MRTMHHVRFRPIFLLVTLVACGTSQDQGCPTDWGGSYYSSGGSSSVDCSTLWRGNPYASGPAWSLSGFTPADGILEDDGSFVARIQVGEKVSLSLVNAMGVDCSNTITRADWLSSETKSVVAQAEGKTRGTLTGAGPGDAVVTATLYSTASINATFEAYPTVRIDGVTHRVRAVRVIKAK